MRTMILGTNPILFVIVGLALGVGLVAVARRRGKRSVEITRYVLAAIAATWVVVDFIITPSHRWTNGILLVVLALVWVVALGYQRFQGSKARAPR